MVCVWLVILNVVVCRGLWVREPIVLVSLVLRLSVLVGLQGISMLALLLMMILGTLFMVSVIIVARYVTVLRPMTFSGLHIDGYMKARVRASSRTSALWLVRLLTYMIELVLWILCS